MASVLRPRYPGSLSGITLYVEESGQQQACQVLAFDKTCRPIHIGRRPTHARDQVEDRSHALFRCPVISRKHAKIHFTEFGNVYITDLNSHHGTHILQPGDTVSRRIEPQAPTLLADGDCVTFGKSVGKDSSLVRPVTVRVKFVYAQARLSTPEVAILNDPSECAEQLSPKPNTGRYGVFVPSCDSSSSGDSDIEQIEPPSSPRQPSERPLMESLRSAGRFGLLRHLLPPIHPVSSRSVFTSLSPITSAMLFSDNAPEPMADDADDSSSAASDDLSDGAQPEPNVIGAWPQSPEPPLSREHSPIASPSRAPSELEVPALAYLAAEMAHRQRVEERLSPDVEENPAPIDGDLNSNLIEIDQIEDVPAPIPQEDDREVIDVDHAPDILPGATSMRDPLRDRLSQSISRGGSDWVEPAPASEAVNEDASTHDNVHGRHTSQVTPDRPLPSVLSWYRGDATEGLVHEADFNAHVEETKMRLKRLEAREEETRLRLYLQQIRNPDPLVDSLKSRLDDLESLVAGLETRRELNADIMNKSLPTSVAALEDLVTVMTQLRDKTEGQQLQIDALNNARIEAEAIVSEVKGQVHETISLKRRRDLSDEGYGIDGEITSQSKDDVMPTVPEPARKRLKTSHAAVKIAKSTAIAAVGAVAAWSLLAFS